MAVEYKDYYKILGVKKDAPDKEIKQAYRRLARKYHPDVNPGDATSEERFKEIGEAYAVLSDAQKRKKYDQFGPSLRDGSFWRGPGAGPRPSSRVYTTTRDYAKDFDASNFGSGFSDFFDALFGQATGRTRGADANGSAGTRTRAEATKGSDVEQSIEVTLEEVATGGN